MVENLSFFLFKMVQFSSQISNQGHVEVKTLALLQVAKVFLRLNLIPIVKPNFESVKPRSV
jgi:hypothetical protein